MIVGGIILGFLLIVFLLALWIFNTSLLKISNVDVSGENIIPASSIEAAVLHDMEGSYAGLFSRANLFLYPRERIVRELLSLYPTLMSADVHIYDFHSISVSVVERQPKALWCGAASGDFHNCLLLDANGLAYANAPDYSGQVYHTYVGPLGSGPLPKQFLTAQGFYSLDALVGAFAGALASDTIKTIEIDEHNDVHLITSNGCEILFALKDDSGAIFQHFSLALTAPPLNSKPLSAFQYVDLRFGNKVYYKLK